MKRTISVILAIVLLLTLAGCSVYGVKEGNYAIIDKKLAAYFAEGEYQEAEELMAANEWYTLKDEELAQTILDGVEDDGKQRARWFRVVGRIDNSLSPRIEERKNGILTTLGVARLYGSSDTTEALEAWSYCSEGSVGYDFYLAVTMLNEGEPLDAGKLLYDHMTDAETKEKFEWFFAYDHMPDVEIPDAQNYLERVLCAAYIAHIRPATYASLISVPKDEYAPSRYLHTDGYLNGHNYDMNIFEQLVMPEDLRNGLPQQISAANGNKILVLDRVEICGKDESELYIDGYLMRSLPEELCAESLKEVGYILLLDYGYLEDSIWYAGTVTARIFDVQTGEEIFTSEMQEGTFPKSYVGESTNVIFGSYPDITDLVREAVSDII